MEIARFVFCLLKMMELKTYIAFFGMISGVYLVLVGPILFKLWIIPKIEKRYGVRVRVDENASLVPFANWGLPAFEIPVYVFFKYIGVETWGMKNPMKATYLYELKKINYDINSADRAEKIVIITSFVFLVCFFASCAVFGFYLYSNA